MLKALLTMTALLVVTGAAQAAIIDEADWTLQDLTKAPVNWTMTGNARINPNAGETPLFTMRLVDDREVQAGAVWQKLKGKVDSFTFIADVRVRFAGSSSIPCPGDGFTLAFADVADPTRDVIETPYNYAGYGGNLGLFAGDDPDARKAIPQFIAFEVNTWHGQGLGTTAEQENCTSGKNETFAFDVISKNVNDRGGKPADAAVGGAKIGQVNPPAGMKIVNGGAYRYQFNVDGATNTMTVYVTGLEETNKQFQKVKVLEQKIGVPVLGFEGRFGLTASGSGHAFEQVDVAHTLLAVPMIAP